MIFSFKFIFIISFISIYILNNFISSELSREIDVSWDFDEFEPTLSLSSLTSTLYPSRLVSGWGNGTEEFIHLRTKVANGELICTILGQQPRLDSPSMYLNVDRRHYLVFRARYEGAAQKARVIMRGTPKASKNFQLLPSSGEWVSSLPLKVLFDSGKVNPNELIDSEFLNEDSSRYGFGSSNIIDGLPYSYYLAPSPRTVSVTIDTGVVRHISSIKITPVGGPSSPQRVVLMRSISLGLGPFETVHSFTMSLQDLNTPQGLKPEIFKGFEGHARYWKVLFVDNYGGPYIGVREIEIEGYQDQFGVVPFNLKNDGKYHMYYLPIYKYYEGMIVRLRFELDFTKSTNNNSEKELIVNRHNFPQTLAFDYIRIVRSPLIMKVRGCLDKYFEDSNFNNPQINITQYRYEINNRLEVNYFTQNNMTLEYATTYDCPHSGGKVISIEGINFGENPIVTIGGAICPLISVSYNKLKGRMQQIHCVLPNIAETKGEINKVERNVRVSNGRHPYLFHEFVGLIYRASPPIPEVPLVVNIGAKKVDLVWNPPGDDFNKRTVTGYKIIWFQPKYPKFISNVTVTNITSTSIKNLEPNTEYVFSIAAISEGNEAAFNPTDMYGRREHLNEGLLGGFSPFTNITSTLPYDFSFDFFNVNSTLNSTLVLENQVNLSRISYEEAMDKLKQKESEIENNLATNDDLSVLLYEVENNLLKYNYYLKELDIVKSKNVNGPTGQFGGEGHYGLVFVGSANIQNCNVSSTCCDGYDPEIGLSSCNSGQSVCAVLPAYMLAYDKAIGSVSRRGVPSNLPYENGAPSEIFLSTLTELEENKGASLPSIACGPAFRLTPSQARSSGSMWYKRKMNVGEGFDTQFQFEISNPSQKCDRLDDVNTFCRSRGADGLAFVIQNNKPDALGKGGSGLGYEGIFNALSVELDTYHNYDQMDYYENHISVLTEGFRFNISANHSRSLATTNRVPDLTDGIHTVRIKYDPNFDPSAVYHQSFQVNGYTTFFLNNADFKNGGLGDWGVGFGLLYVYIDDLYSPVITTPLNLGATLQLEDGRSYIGITAATGDQHWQAHDILSWKFTSLFQDTKYYPPLSVNGEGGYNCVVPEDCTHRVDPEGHYMRENNVWGKDYDSSVGIGLEGYCSSC